MKRLRGSATFAALVATLVILTVASATWAVALQSASEARQGHGAVQARAAAESAIWRYHTDPRTGSARLALGGVLNLGAFTLSPGVRARASVRRVGRELYVLSAVGQATTGGATQIVGYGLWSLNAVARFGAAGAVVSVGGRVGVGPGGAIRGDSTHVAPPGWSGVCVAAIAGADSVVPARRLPPTVSDSTPALQLGRLDPSALLAQATVRAGGVVTPGPRTGAAGCLTSDPMNWGSPSGTGPCSGYRPIIAASGDLVVNGGVGQGILLVPGNLTLQSGARFAGVVLVGGSLRVESGAHLRGLTRVGGDIRVVAAVVQGSACASVLAMDRPELSVPVPIPDAWIDPI